jgi:hypothetical protein
MLIVISNKRKEGRKYMKNIKIMLFVGILIAVISAGSAKAVFYPGANSPDEPTVALWHMDEGTGTNVFDVMGGYDGIFSGTPLPTWTTGRFDSGIHLQPMNPNGVNLGPFTYFNPTITFEFYFKRDTGYNGSDGWMGYFFKTADLWARAWNSNAGKITLTYGVKGYNGWNEISVDVPVGYNEWHHFAFTRLPSGVTPNFRTDFSIYFDGTLVKTGGWDGLFWLPSSPSDVYLGTGDSMGGTFDEARVSSIIRTKFGVMGCGDWGYQPGDVNKDCKVDFSDMAQIATDWLMCTSPFGIGCEVKN